MQTTQGSIGGNRPHAAAAARGGMLMSLLLALGAAQARAAVPVGLEQTMTLTLPSGLVAVPVADQAEVILRIAHVRPLNSRQSQYDLRYTLMTAGGHDLRTYLQSADGCGMGTDLIADAINTEGLSLLPADFGGQLKSHQSAPLPGPVHYRQWLWAGGIMWLIGLAALALGGRRKPAAPAAQTQALDPPVLTTLEKLRGLISRVELGSALTVEEQSRLESLLLAYWREKKGLSQGDVSMAQAMAALRADPQAGALMEDLDNWLHRPASRRRSANPGDFLLAYGKEQGER